VAVAKPKLTLVERLFTDHRAELRTFFLRRVRSKADAADLAQEVYLRMLRVSDHELIRNHVHYLYTVASNLVKGQELDRRQAAAVDIDDAPEQEEARPCPPSTETSIGGSGSPASGWSAWPSNSTVTRRSRSRSRHPRPGQLEISGAFAIDDTDTFRRLSAHP
jgi:DNA-directed RNA polymerase specialized sigma24 family protein